MMKTVSEFQRREAATTPFKLFPMKLAQQFFLFTLLSTFVISCLFASPSFANEKVKFEATQPHNSEKIFLKGNLFKPEGEGPFPAVVLMHGCGGLQPAVRNTMFSYADYLVSNGFAVLNLDSFGPRSNSGGKVCASFKRLRDARQYRTYDAFDAMQYLQDQEFIDANNIFLMGQSNGGSVAINVANANKSEAYIKTKPAFRAVVAYYPWCGTFGSKSVALKSPLLVLGGAKDDWVPPHGCQKVTSDGAELRVTVYPEAAHSFDLNVMMQRYLGKLVGYNKHAAQDGKLKMLAFFLEHLTADVKQKLVKLADSQKPLKISQNSIQ